MINWLGVVDSFRTLRDGLDEHYFIEEPI